MQRKLIALAATVATLSLALPDAKAQSVSETDLAQRVERLAAELAAVKAQLAQLQHQRAEPAAPVPAAVQAAPTPPAAVPTATTPIAATSPAATTAAAAAAPATVLTSYGEINYNRPNSSSENSQADLRRFVLGLQHRFDERTKFVGEVEVEHGVSSADDVGEVAIEQAYVEHQVSPRLAARAGLLLMPLGLLNENHEPTAYYGVERNFVETAIIPSTWREGGLQLVGTLDNGLTLQGGLSTGFNINAWDFSSESEGRESPLGSIHQEMAQARARSLAFFGAANWRGLPGLQLGGGVWSGGATHGEPGVPKSRVTLWDLHARWTPGRWDLAAVYARGSISNTAALNTLQLGSATPIPSRFDGWYAQAAYTLWSQGDYALKPFARWEQFNTARRFADLGAGVTPEAAPTERTVTVGLNFQLTPEVVVKADVQRFREDTNANRFDLGLGWSF